MKALLTIILSVSVLGLTAQDWGVSSTINLSLQKTIVGISIEKELKSKSSLSLQANWGFSKKSYPGNNDSRFSLPYIDDQEELWAGYVSSNSNFQAGIILLGYSQSLKLRALNSPNNFRFKLIIGYGKIWDNYDAIYDSHKIGRFRIRDTYQFNNVMASTLLTYRYTKKKLFIEIAIGPSYYYPLIKYSESDYIYSYHIPFVSTEFELNLSIGRKF